MPDCPHLEQQRDTNGTWTCLHCGTPTHDTPAAVIVTRGIDAIQNTSGRPSAEWPGAIE